MSERPRIVSQKVLVKLVPCDVSMAMLVKHRSTPALQVTWRHRRHREFSLFWEIQWNIDCLFRLGVYGYVCMHKKYTLSLSIYILHTILYICICGLPSQTCVIGEIRVGRWPVVLHVVSVCFYLRHHVLFIFRFDGRGSVAISCYGFSWGASVYIYGSICSPRQSNSTEHHKTLAKPSLQFQDIFVLGYMARCLA